MIRLYKSNSTGYTDFEDNIFSTDRAKINFSTNIATIDTVDYSILAAFQFENNAPVSPNWVDNASLRITRSYYTGVDAQKNPSGNYNIYKEFIKDNNDVLLWTKEYWWDSNDNNVKELTY